jgi:WD40 repeat protein
LVFSPDDRLIVSGGDDTTVRLWNIQDRAMLKQFAGHQKSVVGVRFSQDGKKVLSVDQEGIVKRWPLDMVQDHFPLELPLKPSGPIAFSTDGKTLAVACEDQRVRLVDVANGQSRAALAGHTGRITAVAYAPKGRQLATASEDGTFRLWDVAGQSRHAVTAHPGGVHCLAFSSHEHLLATGGEDRTIRLWDAETTTSLKNLHGHSGPVQSLAFSPDGLTLVSACPAFIKIWDVRAHKEQGSVSLKRSVSGLAVAPDCRSFTTFEVKGRERLRYNLATGSLLNREPAFQILQAVAYAPDGRFEVWGTDKGKVEFRDVRTRERRYHLTWGGPPPGDALQDPVEYLAVSPDSKTLATCGRGSLVRIWNLQTGLAGMLTARELIKPASQPAYTVAALALTPDSRTLITATRSPGLGLTSYKQFLGVSSLLDQLVTSPDDIRLWGVDDRKEHPRLPNQEMVDGVHSLAVTADGKTLLAGTDDGTIERWDLTLGKRLPLLFVSPAAQSARFSSHLRQQSLVPFHPDYHEHVCALAVSPDGKWWATATERDTVQLWDAGRAQIHCQLPKQRQVGCLGFSRDSSTLFVNDGNELVLWDVAEGKEVRRLKGHKEPLRCLALSSDGKLLATGGLDRRIHLWNLDTNTMQPLVGHMHAVTSLSFTPDGKTLASGSFDGTVRLWHVATAQELGQMEIQKGPVHAVTFTPDGRFLVGAAQGPYGISSVRLWRGMATR